jgi:hypothetical protein
MKQIKESNATAKHASGFKRTLALFVDVGILYFLVLLTFKHFQIDKIFPSAPVVHRYLYVILYYYFIFTIITITIFSQTIGQFVFGIKVVSKEKLKRLSLFRSFCSAFFLRFLSNSVVVNIR